MQLQELFDYKNRLMKDILTDSSVVSLVDDIGRCGDNPYELAYTQVFPYEYIPETTQEGYTFICFDVDIVSAGKMIYSPILYIWVFSHKSRLRLPEGGVRTDSICSEICNKINGSRYYGLGELNLYSVKRFAPMTDYNGKLMTFQAKDISKVFDGNKSIPSNRKSN